MSVRHLKAELDRRGIDYSDCTERRHLVERLTAAPSHPPGDEAPVETRPSAHPADEKVRWLCNMCFATKGGSHYDMEDNDVERFTQRFKPFDAYKDGHRPQDRRKNYAGREHELPRCNSCAVKHGKTGSSPLKPPEGDPSRIGTKFTLCTRWLQKGECRFGDRCHFAHGEKELVERAHERDDRGGPRRSHSRSPQRRRRSRVISIS